MEWHLNFFFSGFGVFFFCFVFSFKVSLIVKVAGWYVKMRVVIWLLCISSPE